MSPYFSVILPARNAAATLAEAMQSVLSQDFRDLELITSVNASADDSFRIASELAARDGRAKVLYSGREGVSEARNAGLKEASGRYVLFCDADDRYLPGAMSELREALRVREVDFLAAFCERETVPDTGTLTALQPEALYRAFLDKPAFAEAASSLLAGRNVSLYRPWAIAYRRDFLLAQGIRFDPACRVMEDIVFNGRCLRRAGSAAILDRKLYHYTVREGSLGRRRDLAYVREAGEALEILMRENGGRPEGAYLYFRILVRMALACADAGDRRALKYLEAFLRREDMHRMLLEVSGEDLSAHFGTALVLKTALYAMREGNAADAASLLKVLSAPAGSSEA